MGAKLTEEDYVFCHPDGSPYDPSTVSHAFSKVLWRAGLPPMPLHGLRHSHATMFPEYMDLIISSQEIGQRGREKITSVDDVWLIFYPGHW
ncbi:tyrosine-type recombinase/integrase [Chloroflexota bacterium]